MNFALTDEQELLLQSLAEIVERHGSEEYMRKCDENDESPKELIVALHDAGFDMLGVPEEFGGTPCDTVTLMLYHEEFARLCSGAYACECTGLAMSDMVKFGSEQQIQDCVDAIEQLKTPFCLGFSEPSAGSDSAAIETNYRKVGDKIIVNGTKTFCSRADNANYMMCLAYDADADSKVFTTLWVPMDSAGITMTAIHKLGWRQIHSCDVFLDSVEIPVENIVGKEGDGFINVMKNFEIERLVMAATALGEAELAFECAARHANSRVQFGKPIGSFQLVQKLITDMRVKIENMKNMVYKAAWMEDSGQSVNIMAAMAKYYCAQASHEVIDDAIEILGGIGLSDDMPVGRVWRNNRINGIGGGTKEIMVHIAGRAILKEYR